jgi:hypothetical protein
MMMMMNDDGDVNDDAKDEDEDFLFIGSREPYAVIAGP